MVGGTLLLFSAPFFSSLLFATPSELAAREIPAATRPPSGNALGALSGGDTYGHEETVSYHWGQNIGFTRRQVISIRNLSCDDGWQQTFGEAQGLAGLLLTLREAQNIASSHGKGSIL